MKMRYKVGVIFILISIIGILLIFTKQEKPTVTTSRQLTSQPTPTPLNDPFFNNQNNPSVRGEIIAIEKAPSIKVRNRENKEIEVEIAILTIKNLDNNQIKKFPTSGRIRIFTDIADLSKFSTDIKAIQVNKEARIYLDSLEKSLKVTRILYIQKSSLSPTQSIPSGQKNL